LHQPVDPEVSRGYGFDYQHHCPLVFGLDQCLDVASLKHRLTDDCAREGHGLACHTFEHHGHKRIGFAGEKREQHQTGGGRDAQPGECHEDQRSHCLGLGVGYRVFFVPLGGQPFEGQVAVVRELGVGDRAYTCESEQHPNEDPVDVARGR